MCESLFLKLAVRYYDSCWFLGPSHAISCGRCCLCRDFPLGQSGAARLRKSLRQRRRDLRWDVFTWPVPLLPDRTIQGATVLPVFAWGCVRSSRLKEATDISRERHTHGISSEPQTQQPIPKPRSPHTQAYTADPHSTAVSEASPKAVARCLSQCSHGRSAWKPSNTPRQRATMALQVS